MIPDDSKARDRPPWHAVIPLTSIIVALSRKLRIGPKLVLGFGILIALMLVGYGLGISASDRATREIDRTTYLRAPATLASARAQANLLRLVADLQAYLALGDSYHQESYFVVQTEFEANLDELEAIVSRSGAQGTVGYRELAANLARLREDYRQWSALVPELFDLRNDQLRREPALRVLIVDAAPLINTVIANSGSMIKTQEGRGPTAANIALMGAMAEFQSSFYAMVAGLRGYVTAKRDSFKFEFRSNLDANQLAWENLIYGRDLLSRSQQAEMERIAAARTSFLALPDRMFTIVEGDHAREDLFLFRTEALPLSDEMLRILADETTFQQDVLQSDLALGRRRLDAAQMTSIVGALVVLLAGLTLAGGIARDIARPILRLTDTAQQIQNGDLAAQAEVTTEDEIGFLGTAFNAMTSKLRETLQSLLDYLEQVKVVMSAAAEVEEGYFDPVSLNELAAREDALGQLARVFQKMAREIRLREERLRHEVIELTIALDETRQKRKVAEITETEYFRSLQNEAETLRNLISGITDEQTERT